MSKNKKLVIVLLVIVALLVGVPLFALQGAEFGGSDDAGSTMIEEIQGGEYEPWFTPVLETMINGELPGEVESLIFCLQTGIGVGILAFFMGRLVERKKLGKEEAELFAQLANKEGWQVLSFDLPGHGCREPIKLGLLPWDVVPEVEQVYDYIEGKYNRVALYGSSVGAFFSMLAYRDKPIERALFVSPILDMELMIRNMMKSSGVSEERLEKEQMIETNFGFMLIWRYLQYVVERPIDRWDVPTSILYPGRDNFTDISVVKAFVQHFGADLTVYKKGEHWFHTPEQLAVLRDWAEEKLK